MANVFGGGGGPRNTSTSSNTTNTTIRDIGFSGDAANQLATTIVEGATTISANALITNLESQQQQLSNTATIAGLLSGTTNQAVEALKDTRQTSGISTSTLILVGLGAVAIILIARK